MIYYKSIILFLLVLFFTFQAHAKDKKISGFSTYKGGWFEIQYPKNFSVKPSIPSSIPNKFDSAFFISQDKKVKFYVFAPQWSGDATDITINTAKETEKDTKNETKDGFKYRWFTYEAKDGSWTRSYQETTNEEGTTKLIIGVEYEDQDSYKKHKDSYLKFKKSIVQFAD
jgi:hypothetical protein